MSRSKQRFKTAERVTAAGIAIGQVDYWAMERARGDFPRRHFENLAARMPDARVRDADAGHFVPMERPDLVVAVALEAVEVKPTA